MKRLKKYFMEMPKSDSTYKNIYEGPYYDYEFEDIVYQPIYYKDDISYSIFRSHKQTLDKPIVLIRIPSWMLKIENKYLIKDNYIPISDYCLRTFNYYINRANQGLFNRTRPLNENGWFFSYIPEGEVLNRSASYLNEENKNVYLTIQILVQLPRGNHRKAARMLCNDLPNIVERFIEEFDRIELINRIQLYYLQEKIRDWLTDSEYCAFIGNGSILPRTNSKKIIPFYSTKKDEIEICGIKGMGIKRGVTVITGGGYSGKSTLLDAINSGVYNHVYGDGREYVITDRNTMKITAEDGRCVKNVDLSLFIRWLPQGEIMDFSTEHASGATSQAANVIEAISYGMKVLLIDEDKSATNFMIQDDIMRKLIEKEPIIPFTTCVNQLFVQFGVSSILVVGGSGEYLSKASNIIIMDDYKPINITEKVRKIKPLERIVEDYSSKLLLGKRYLNPEKFSSYPSNSSTEKLEISDFGYIILGDEKVDFRMLHNITTKAQATAIAFIIRDLQKKCYGSIKKLDYIEKIKEELEEIEQHGFDCVFSTFFNTDIWLEEPRLSEICGVIDRMKNISFIKEN